MKMFCLFTLLTVSMVSCSKWFKDEELTIVRRPYNGTELKINGYYYHEKEGVIGRTYFFYRNGVMLYGIGTDTLDNDLEKYDEWFTSETFLNFIKTNKRRWGVFEIHDDSIVFERWGTAEGGFPVLRFSGNIINDTTFRITRSEYPHHGEMYERNDVFYFHAFSPKPDSTNVFIP